MKISLRKNLVYFEKNILNGDQFRHIKVKQIFLITFEVLNRDNVFNKVLLVKFF